MNYNETLTYLFSQLPMFQRVGRAAYKANLDNTLKLDEYFNHPHRQFKSIHIAGTNGKGSTSHMLASILQHAGYNVGLYTSPHLKDFRERIRVNGEMIPEQEVVNFVDQHKELFDTIKPSFFEMTVALAFDFFARRKIDIAVVEVGLGGRLDSTNIITPILSIITNIGLDHTDLLGDTLQKIAIEKAGIIKAKIPIVISQTQPEIAPIFIEKSREKDSPITFADKNFTVTNNWINDSGRQTIEVDSANTEKIAWELDLMGNYQKLNLPGVLAAVDILNKQNFNIDDNIIARGLKSVQQSTGLMGRWQKLQDLPKVYCDTGHNVDGITQVITQISKIPYHELHMVIGMVGDKNIDGMLTLLPSNATYYFTQAKIPRALNYQELQKHAERFGLKGNAYPSVTIALDAAKKAAKQNDLIFVGGSTFVVAEVV